MRTFQKILFPVDLSDSCTAAVPWIEMMAKRFQAQVTLLHVLEMPPAYFSDWYGYAAVIDMSAVRDSRINEVNAYLAEKFQGLTVQRQVVEGDAAKVISQYANEHGMDLIMMPTHGYGMFRSLLLGSVTAKVLHDADCPVWTGVHVEETPAPSSDPANVMCAVDLSEGSSRTLRFAAKLARDFQAKLWLVHAVPAAEARPEKYFDADLNAFLEEEARKTIQKMQKAADIEAQICIGAGEVANVVREAALHHEAGLLVIGRGHANRALGRLRTNTYSIIRQSPCPVISV